MLCYRSWRKVLTALIPNFRHVFPWLQINLKLVGTKSYVVLFLDGFSLILVSFLLIMISDIGSCDLWSLCSHDLWSLCSHDLWSLCSHDLSDIMISLISDFLILWSHDLWLLFSHNLFQLSNLWFPDILISWSHNLMISLISDHSHFMISWFLHKIFKSWFRDFWGFSACYCRDWLKRNFLFYFVFDVETKIVLYHEWPLS